MCFLSCTQVVASAMNKCEVKEISVSRLVRYNSELLCKIPDYYNTIDINELVFEISSVASEFEIFVTESYEKIVRLVSDKDFNYESYKKTIPPNITDLIETIELPL